MVHQDDRAAGPGDHLGERSSQVSAETSLTIAAPAPSAASITAALRVSIETAVPPAARRATAGSNALDLVAFPDRLRARAGRFAADVDDRGARLGHCEAGLRGRFAIAEAAAVGKAVGRDVEDARPPAAGRAEPRARAAAAAAAARSGSATPARPRRPGPAGSRRSVRPRPARNRRGGAVHSHPLDRGEPEHPAGQPRHLAVMAEGRVDEGGGPQIMAQGHEDAASA